MRERAVPDRPACRYASPAGSHLRRIAALSGTAQQAFAAVPPEAVARLFASARRREREAAATFTLARKNSGGQFLGHLVPPLPGGDAGVFATAGRPYAANGVQFVGIALDSATDSSRLLPKPSGQLPAADRRRNRRRARPASRQHVAQPALYHRGDQSGSRERLLLDWGPCPRVNWTISCSRR
jgi:hypothetical protein